jgi:uncharacterized protein (DUF736 family)
MIIGNFNYDSKADTFAGALTTLSVQRDDIHIRPVAKSADKEPDYRIGADTAFGRVEFGAAWKRTSERGQAFLSVSLDDPSLGGPLNAALFLDESNSTAQLVWNRQKAKDSAEAAVSGDHKKVRPKAKAA